MEDVVEDSSAPVFNWRAFLEVHPAADLFPLLSETALKELAEDIKANGLRAPIIAWSPSDNSVGPVLLDGRNRLDALALLGLIYETGDHHVGIRTWTGTEWAKKAGERIRLEHIYGDPYAIALSLNVHRRHLSNKQKSELVDKLIKANPEKSDRQIADQAKVGHPKVAKRRKRLEESGDVERRSTSVDTRGRRQPARKSKSKSKSTPAAAGAAEDDDGVERMKAAHAANAAAEPDPTDPPVVNGAVIPLATTTELGETVSQNIRDDLHTAKQAFEALTSHPIAQIAKAVSAGDHDLIAEFADFFTDLKIKLSEQEVGHE